MTRPNRQANHHDRPCDDCGNPMIGIMKVSDGNGHRAPRKICVGCEQKRGKITDNGRQR